MWPFRWLWEASGWKASSTVAGLREELVIILFSVEWPRFARWSLSDTRGWPPFSRCESCPVNHGLWSVLTAMRRWLPKQIWESCFHQSCLHGAGVLFTGLRQVKDIGIHVFRDGRKREMFWGVVWYTQRWERVQESGFKVKSRSVPPCDRHPLPCLQAEVGMAVFSHVLKLSKSLGSSAWFCQELVLGVTLAPNPKPRGCWVGSGWTERAKWTELDIC